VSPNPDAVGQPPLDHSAEDRSLGVDPLARSRDRRSPEIDVFCAGRVFLDVIFTGLPTPPRVGREVWAEGMGSCPGGSANIAVALSRLGLRTALASPFGADVYGDFCWQLLEEQEGIDLSPSRRIPGWHSPVTVSMAYERDRALVTHGHPWPIAPDDFIGTPRPCRAVVTSIGEQPEEWPSRARSAGSLVFADVGWDPSGVWSEETLRRLDGVDAFLPNALEAMSYTHTTSPEEALAELGRVVPVVVVTLGADGAIGLDTTSGEVAQVSALPVESLDPTGAGDVFMAAFVTGTLAGWDLETRLHFAALCASLSVRHFGGSLSAPGWSDVVSWWTGLGAREHELAQRYDFLHDVVPRGTFPAVGRAPATIGLRPPAAGR
jgi:sugar/nucleoside kinase (ribokinase family)